MLPSLMTDAEEELYKPNETVDLSRLDDLTTRQQAIRYQLLPPTQSTIAYRTRSKSDKRSQRLRTILDGTPSKGTVVIACRGTDSSDSEDVAVDARMFIKLPTTKIFGTQITGNNNPPSFSGDPYYERTKNHIVSILQRDFIPSGSNQSYKDFWDVFITGHSLGGALTDQLLIDGVGKGGISFNGPRTEASNANRQNVYSIINESDRVVGTSSKSPNNAFDYVTPKAMSGINVTQHMLDQLGPLTGRDGLPLFNDKIFFPADKNMNNNKQTIGAGMNDLSGEGPAPKVDTFRTLAKEVYATSTDPIKNGLLLPQYTLKKPNGKPIVNFYIYTTPQPYEIYASMPVYNTIKVQLNTIFGVAKVDKSFQLDNLWK